MSTDDNVSVWELTDHGALWLWMFFCARVSLISILNYLLATLLANQRRHAISYCHQGRPIATSIIWRIIAARVSEVLKCATTYIRVCPTSVTVRFLWLPRGRGTVCRHRPGPPPQYWHSDERLFRQSFGWQKSGTVSCWLIVYCHWDKSRVTFYC